MKRIIFLTITILVLLNCVCIESVLSFSGATHRILSDYAATNSVLKKENYLVDYLGLQNGLNEVLKWGNEEKRIRLWLQDGSDLEDEGVTRSFNHFHNPLKDWANAGLDDYLTIPIPPYLYPHYVTGKSALVWAQDGAAQNNAPGGDWSWQKTRDLYYTALTSITDKERQQYFAMTFRGLGHQIHLIEDMGVPEHARNDAHAEQTIYAIIGLGELFFEPWAERNGAFISQLAQNPKPPTVSFNTTIYNNYVPITQLTDTNKYNGSNPSTSTDIGLSEYTNANFFSDDTIFAAERYSSGDRHYFPYPKESDTDLQDYINQGKLPEIILAWDGMEDLGFWIAKKSGNEIEIKHFLKPTYHTLNLPINIPIYYRTFYRDEKCYEDYTEKLVPRAVGYSAGLLDYFFRGKIEITEPLAIGDSISLFAQNVSKGEEEMSGGKIMLVVKYKVPNVNDYLYIVFAPQEYDSYSIPRNETTKLSFSVTIPSEAEDVTLQVVYKGNLGQEAEAVAVGLMPYIPKPVIILYKNFGTEQNPVYDWWYYIVDSNEGFHKDPKASFPSKPEIISKWWSCDGMEEKEYFTRVSPAFKAIGSGGSGDECGLLNFKTDRCCGVASGLPNETTNWTASPCGGDSVSTCWYSISGFGWIQWPCSRIDTACGGCADGTQSMYFPAANNTRTRTGGQTRACPLGYSWDLAIGDLEEKIDVGPRTTTSGNESSSIYTVLDARCSPIEKHWYRCYAGWNKDTCVCTNRMGWLPTHLSMVCEGDLSCLGMQGNYGDGKAYQTTDTYGQQYGSNQQGCVSFKRTTRGASGYNDNAVSLKTRVKVGTKETLFNGQWSEHYSQQASEQVDNWTIGWAGGACISCNPSRVIGTSKLTANYTYTELSYGVAGWSTIVASDGKFAVLIPKMKLEASATSTAGNASGNISSTTTALLRIIDGSEVNFELAQADMEYALNGMPGSRDDLGIKPNCWPRDLPLDIKLQGLHWYSDDAFLVAFMLKDTFHAYLLKKQDGAWSALQLVSFEEWVNNNDLKGHIMFLK